MMNAPMRPVDDAQHAEGDGTADGREEADCGERGCTGHEAGRLHQRKTRADAAEGGFGRGCHGRVGFGMDGKDALRGQRRRDLVRRCRRGDCTRCLERGMSAVAGNLVKAGHDGGTADRAVADVADQGGALFGGGERGGGAAGRHACGTGRCRCDVGAGRRVFLTWVPGGRGVAAGWAAGGEKRIEHRAQAGAGLAAEAFDGCPTLGAVAEAIVSGHPSRAFCAARPGSASPGIAARKAGGWPGSGLRAIAERGAATVRIGVRQPDLHACGGDQRADPGVGAKPVAVALRRGAGGGAGGRPRRGSGDRCRPRCSARRRLCAPSAVAHERAARSDGPRAAAVALSGPGGLSARATGAGEMGGCSGERRSGRPCHNPVRRG
jgi:hypothetical protein